MQTWISPSGIPFEWDDTLKPGDIITMGYCEGYFVFSHYSYQDVPEGCPPRVVGQQVLNRKGAVSRHNYTTTTSAHMCMRAATKLEQRIAKKITEAAELNRILEKIKK